MNTHRLSFEEMRDAWLAATGELDLRVGGKPAELFAGGNARRTLYARVDRERLPTVMRTFDFANPDLSIPQRNDTIVPQQALFGLNHPFLAARAKALVRRTEPAGNGNAERVRRLYELLFQREPTAAEMAAALAFVQPESAALVKREKPNAWQYGYGEWDEAAGRMKSFTPLPHFNGTALAGRRAMAGQEARLGAAHRDGRASGQRSAARRRAPLGGAAGWQLRHHLHADPRAGGGRWHPRVHQPQRPRAAALHRAASLHRGAERRSHADEQRRHAGFHRRYPRRVEQRSIPLVAEDHAAASVGAGGDDAQSWDAQKDFCRTAHDAAESRGSSSRRRSCSPTNSCSSIDELRHASPHPPLTRREFLRRSGVGFGGPPSFSPPATPAPPPTPGRGAPHFAPKAKRVIHFFLNGGPSHVDTFDPKPALAEIRGQAAAADEPAHRAQDRRGVSVAVQVPEYGQSGIEVSELFAKTAQHIDDIAVIRSMQAQVPNHEPSLMLMNCGDSVQARPSVGSWVMYGLGTENQNLPGFIAMCPGGYPIKDAENWQSGFPARRVSGHVCRFAAHGRRSPHRKHPQPARDAGRAAAAARSAAHAECRAHRRERLDPPARRAHRILRAGLPHADRGGGRLRCLREPQHIRDLYGERVHGRQTLIARRLLERGVRFVQLWHGAGQPWDNHDNIEENHRKLAARTRSAHRRAAQRSQAARHARRHARHLGRRVWPHADGGDERRHQPSSAAITITTASASGWPAAASRAAPSTAAPMSSASPRWRIPSACTTSTPPSCTSWASITSGSPIATPGATSASRRRPGARQRRHQHLQRRRGQKNPATFHCDAGIGADIFRSPRLGVFARRQPRNRETGQWRLRR